MSKDKQEQQVFDVERIRELIELMKEKHVLTLMSENIY